MTEDTYDKQEARERWDRIEREAADTARKEAERAADNGSTRRPGHVVDTVPPALHEPDHEPDAEPSDTTPEDTGPPADTAGPAPSHSGQVLFAKRLAARHPDRLLHVYGIGWHTYEHGRWRFDDRGHATRAVLAELKRGLTESAKNPMLRRDVERCESAAGVAGVLGVARNLEPFAATVADLDADPHLLNVANGTLDLRTGTVRAHAPADRITKVCRGAFSDDAEAPRWNAFLRQVLPDDDVRGFVQRLVGVGLLGEVREHVLPIFTGTGANGKTVFDKAIRFALGDYAGTAEPDLFMNRDNGHPTGEMDLLGMRWIAVSESDRGRRLAEATVKRLTGGDTIRARRMRQNFVEFTPSHTPLLITNHLPAVSGDDLAIWRRLRVVPFTVVIPPEDQDRGLTAALELEADGILAWAVTGWRHYQDRGLDEPGSVVAATARYQHDSDAVARFVAERCTLGVAMKATTGMLHDAWAKWQVEDGCKPMSSKAFGLALDRLGYLTDPPVNGKRWRPGIAVGVELESEET